MEKLTLESKLWEYPADYGHDSVHAVQCYYSDLLHGHCECKRVSCDS